MNTTRATLLIRIKNPRDTAAWAEFHDLYAPLLYRYARSRGLGHEDAEDVRATCYETIVRQIRQFDYQKEKGGFKAWLRTFVSRRVVDLFRKHRQPLADSHELAELPAREAPRTNCGKSSGDSSTCVTASSKFPRKCKSQPFKRFKCSCGTIAACRKCATD